MDLRPDLRHHRGVIVVGRLIEAVEPAGDVLLQGAGLVLDHPDDHAVERGPAAVVAVELQELDEIRLLPAREAEWPASDGRAQVGLAGVVVRLARQDRGVGHRQLRQERGERLREPQHDGAIIRRRETGDRSAGPGGELPRPRDRLEQETARRAGLLPQQTLEGVGHVPRRDGAAVVEQDPVPEAECVYEAVGGDRPRFRHRRLDLQRLRIEPDEPAIDVQDDGLGELVVGERRVKGRRVLVQPEAVDLLGRRGRRAGTAARQGQAPGSQDRQDEEAACPPGSRTTSGVDTAHGGSSVQAIARPRRGSRRSLNPSPRRLKPSTTRRIARPGATQTHGLARK